ncbi:hypothetical protein [Polymorphum gilvum]|uniref:hypothetical protein n=1 Tax=Polymorphum gilvum TaxID=991904 RepID=UPI0003140747|nr:hypothetical protein [Polymorphum gilvum]
MNAQDELKTLFADLDLATDRALAGLNRVRADALADRPALPWIGIPFLAELGLYSAFVALLARMAGDRLG